MTEQRTFGSLKCTVTNEDGDLFVRNRFRIYTKSNHVNYHFEVSAEFLKDPSMDQYIEKTFLRMIKKAEAL